MNPLAWLPAPVSFTPHRGLQRALGTVITRSWSRFSSTRAGLVYDYNIVSGNADTNTRSQLEDTLFFSVFAPA